MGGVRKTFLASDGTQYIIDDEVGLHFVQSLDSSYKPGVGVEGLAASLGNRPEPWPDYCNYTITPDDLDDCLLSGREHYYPVFANDGNIFACNNPDHLDVPIPDRMVRISRLSKDTVGLISIVYRAVSKVEGVYHIRVSLE
jgi:hypothetical protein